VCKGRRTLREAWEVWRRPEGRIDALGIQAGEWLDCVGNWKGRHTGGEAREPSAGNA
jgi:hypothetical protein